MVESTISKYINSLAILLATSFSIILQCVPTYMYFNIFMGIPVVSLIVIFISLFPVMITVTVCIESLREVWKNDVRSAARNEESIHGTSKEDQRKKIEKDLLTRTIISIGTRQNTELVNSSNNDDRTKVSPEINNQHERSYKESEDLESGKHIELGYFGTLDNDKEAQENPSAPPQSVTLSTSNGAGIESYSAESCDICLCNYELGEEICLSPNKECWHVFHKECIIDWLTTRPNCPICRRIYVFSDQKVEILRM